MKNNTITIEQAYMAMYSFLENYYTLTKSDDIGGLLGSMSLLNDGSTADPAVQEEWEEAIEKSLKLKVNANLELK